MTELWVPEPGTSPWGMAADLLDPPVKYLERPKQWVEDKLREVIWSKQVDIMDSVRDNRYTAVHSCHESGKSFIAARAVAWWIDAHPPGTAFAVTTAPTGAQVRAILWKEINRAHAGGNLPGRCNQTEWWLGNEMVAFGRKPSEYNSEAFQGIHAKYVLIVIDEANGVTKPLWDAADTLIANETGRLLAIGNPDDPTSHFSNVCKPGSGFNVIHISAFDTPNFTGEEVPADVSDVLISPTWVEERKVRWGEESPLYISKVLGNFPPFASDTVVPWTWVQEVRKSEGAHILWPELLVPKPPVEIGVDVGAGGDETVIWARQGGKALRKWTDHSADPEKVVGLIMQVIRQWHVEIVKIDVIGIGWGVSGFLKKMVEQAFEDPEDPFQWAVDIININVAESPSDKQHYRNLRSELWWEVGRELCRLKAWDLSLVDDDTTAQLISPKYSIAANGLLQVESKDDIRKRIGRSTDDADALLMAFWQAPREVWEAI